MEVSPQNIFTLVGAMMFIWQASRRERIETYRSMSSIVPQFKHSLQDFDLILQVYTEFVGTINTKMTNLTLLGNFH